MENQAYNKSPNISNMSDSFEKTPSGDYPQPYGEKTPSGDYPQPYGEKTPSGDYPQPYGGPPVVHQYEPPKVYMSQPVPLRAEPPPHVRKPDSPAQERWKFVHFIVFSTIVFLCCNTCFGFVSGILALLGFLEAKNGRQAPAQFKYKLSLILGAVGVAVGLITLFIVVTLYMYACYGDVYGEPRKVVSCLLPVN